MDSRIDFFKKLLSLVVNALIAVYFIYIFFLYLWSTFRYIVPNMAFILALLITASVVGVIGWFKYSSLLIRK